MNRCTTLLSLSLLFVVAGQARAHKPIFPDGRGCDQADAIAIEDVSVSQVAYTELTQTCPQLWLSFDAVAGQDLYLQIALPQIERFKDLPAGRSRPWPRTASCQCPVRRARGVRRLYRLHG